MKETTLALQTTKPTTEGRLEKVNKSFELLEKLEIPYAWLDHEVKMSIADCADIDKVLEIELCKNLFLCTKTREQFYLLMLPGTKKFVTKDVSRMVGSSRLEFAPEEYLLEYMNLTPGSVGVMGLMHDTDQKVRLLIDREILKHQYIGSHPCINTTSFRMPTKDFLEKLIPALHHEPLILDI